MKTIRLYDIAEARKGYREFVLNFYGSEILRQKGEVNAYRKMFIETLEDGKHIVVNEVYTLCSLGGSKGLFKKNLRAFNKNQFEEAQKFCEGELEKTITEIERDGIKVMRFNSENGRKN